MDQDLSGAEKIEAEKALSGLALAVGTIGMAPIGAPPEVDIAGVLDETALPEGTVAIAATMHIAAMHPIAAMERLEEMRPIGRMVPLEVKEPLGVTVPLEVKEPPGVTVPLEVMVPLEVTVDIGERVLLEARVDIGGGRALELEAGEVPLEAQARGENPVDVQAVVPLEVLEREVVRGEKKGGEVGDLAKTKAASGEATGAAKSFSPRRFARPS